MRYFPALGVLCRSQVRRQEESALLTDEVNGHSWDTQTALLAAWESGWKISGSLAKKIGPAYGPAPALAPALFFSRVLV